MKKFGYSGTSLTKKLGIKPGDRIRIIQAPEHYFDLFEDWPEQVTIDTRKTKPKNLIHVFSKEFDFLEEQLLLLKTEISSNGMIWVSWPKKAAKVPTDITEDAIRQYALSIGLVDVKVCAVDDVWSGLKLVIPVKNRMGH
jgi:hypothetical protein